MLSWKGIHPCAYVSVGLTAHAIHVYAYALADIDSLVIAPNVPLSLLNYPLV
jgi:hypothetical protein